MGVLWWRKPEEPVRDAVGERVLTVTSPGSWEGGVMSAMGITRWSDMNDVPWQDAIQVAAVAAAVRIVSESVGSLVMRVFTGDALARQPVYDATQAELFQDPAPSMGLSSFDFWSDIAASVEVNTAAFVWKVRDASGRVVELWPLDPDFFSITGQPYDRHVFGWQNGKRVEVTGDVLVIRSWSPKPAAAGASTMQLHHKTWKWATAYEEYRGRYFDNDGNVNQVIEGAPQSREQRHEMARGWAAAFGGIRNKGKVGMVWGGASLKQMTSTLRDAQAAELATAIAQDVARAYRIMPAALLYAESAPVREATLEMIRGQFYTFTLAHRLRRIERAFAADRDVFPDRSQYPRFDTSEFIRADTATLGQLAHDMRQDGSLNPDEQRALVLGLPAIPGGAGKQFIQVPVGGGGGTIGPGAQTPQTPQD